MKKKAILIWRKRQPASAIMRPATFQKIKEKAKKYGATSPEKVAGKAYWQTAKAKYRKYALRKRKKG